MLVHPGGPFWARKDQGAWSIPKGECEPDEDYLDAARREYREETGSEIPTGKLIELGAFKVSSGKTVSAWALEADFDTKHVKSSTFEMEWPPKSGQNQEFPEVDKAEWFPMAVAIEKSVKGQVQIIEKLAAVLEVEISKQVKYASAKPKPKSKTNDKQASLF